MGKNDTERDMDTKGCLKALLELKDGVLTYPELLWVKDLGKTKDRPFSGRETRLVMELYERACLREEEPVAI